MFESGGGNTTNLDLDKFGPALRWMTYEAILSGLEMETVKGKWEKLVEPHNSMGAIWLLVECLPIKRLAYKGQDKKGRQKTTSRCASFAFVVVLAFCLVPL